MAHKPAPATGQRPLPWWRSIGPALITACVVFGPGSLLVSSNVGAEHGYELLWLVLVTAVLMGTYMTTSARIGVLGQATPCTLVAERINRPVAAVIGVNLCLITAAFQFSNNLAVVAATEALMPVGAAYVPVVLLNALIIFFLFAAKQIYHFLERVMKVMVGIILVSFVINLMVAGPSVFGILRGLIPGLPENVSLGLPQRIEGRIEDPMLLIASLIGTTFSVAAAFFQGNLVREKGWTLSDYTRGIRDSIAGVSVLMLVSSIVMITAATVIRGQPAEDIGVLAQSLRPLLGPTSHVIFCIGLFAVAMNPFLINAVIGGTILADGLGKSAQLSDFWPRVFTVVVLLVGMIVAILALQTGERPVTLIIFGQALTVVGNPIMAATILWLANRKDIMGDRKNSWVLNLLGGLGFLVVLFIAIRVSVLILLRLT